MDALNGYVVMCCQCIAKGPLRDTAEMARLAWQERFCTHRLEVH